LCIATTANGYISRYAILTTEANNNIAPYHDRKMAVLRRAQRMEWLNLSLPEHEPLRPPSIGTFRVDRIAKHVSLYRIQDLDSNKGLQHNELSRIA
jgi:putative SOS response-associated peptidase YedK